MSDKVPTYTEENIPNKFQKSLTQMLEDFKIDPKEAQELLQKFDIEKKEIIEITSHQLSQLKEQFWDELNTNNFIEFIKKQASLYLKISKPDTELLYNGVSDFKNFDTNEKYEIDLKNPIQPEKVSDDDWWKTQDILHLSQELDIADWNISITKEHWVILELDTSGSNLYIKLDGNEVIITGQNDGVLFVEKVSKEDFVVFCKNYDTTEHKRILEQVWFIWGLTLWWILAFSLKTWIWLLLWNIWTWLWLYRWYQIYKWYHLSKNESLEVLQEYKEHLEIIKNYLYFSQIWYITSYRNGFFETIDGERLSKDEIWKEKVDISPEKYQLLRGLWEKWYKPKIISKWKYELDMNWLFDNSPLIFDWNNIKFSTSNFENGREFSFTDSQTAFETIQKINEYLDVEMQIKNTNSNNESLYMNNNNSILLEKKWMKLKWEILEK